MLAIAGGVAGVALASWTLERARRLDSGERGRVRGSKRSWISACWCLRSRCRWSRACCSGWLLRCAPRARICRARLKDQGANVSGGKANVRLRKWLMVSQMALTAMLLAAAGFFAQSLLNLKKQDLGCARGPRAGVLDLAGTEPLHAGANDRAGGARSRKDRSAARRALGERVENPVLADSDAASNIRCGRLQRAGRRRHERANENWIGSELSSRRWGFRC